MDTAAPTGCARCGTILEGTFRFCPECGLPVSGEGVLSTEIDELRRRVETQGATGRDTSWRRLVPALAAAGMFAFVVTLGLVLFNPALLEPVLPPSEPPAATPAVPRRPNWEPDWERIAPGAFVTGDPREARRARIEHTYWIAKHETTNALWLDFLKAEQTRLVRDGLWRESYPGGVLGWSIEQGVPRVDPPRLEEPVRNVTPTAVVDFCRWLTDRLGEAGVEIRIPTGLEWEYAARGADGRTYPWGDDPVSFPTAGEGPRMVRLRAGLGSGPFAGPSLVADGDVSPHRVVGMAGNVGEWTLRVPPVAIDDEGTLAEPDAEGAAAGGRYTLGVANLRRLIQALGVARRGGSYVDDELSAATTARTWNSIQAGPSDNYPWVGFRLVKVKVPN